MQKKYFQWQMFGFLFQTLQWQFFLNVMLTYFKFKWCCIHYQIYIDLNVQIKVLPCYDLGNHKDGQRRIILH
jgi:hypothetical protein